MDSELYFLAVILAENDIFAETEIAFFFRILTLIYYMILLGDMLVQGLSLVKGSISTSPGSDIVISRVPSKKNNIIRFSSVKMETLGKMESESSSFLSVLLDQEIIKVSGNLLYLQEPLRIGDEILVSLSIYLREDGILAEHVLQRMDHDVLSARKFALFQLFERLGLVPLRGSLPGKLRKELKVLHSDGAKCPDGVIEDFVSEELLENGLYSKSFNGLVGRDPDQGMRLELRDYQKVLFFIFKMKGGFGIYDF